MEDGGEVTSDHSDRRTPVVEDVTERYATNKPGTHGFQVIW